MKTLEKTRQELANEAIVNKTGQAAINNAVGILTPWFFEIGAVRKDAAAKGDRELLILWPKTSNLVFLQAHQQPDSDGTTGGTEPPRKRTRTERVKQVDSIPISRQPYTTYIPTGAVDNPP
ncbi:hypothetical protein F5B20DRAFT_582006 [Whalleya microplaca]|nr:hypothetical protein F5B20DRAFT_582006 [Whalleya microplaca]